MPDNEDGSTKQLSCRNWITADGSSGFKAEPNRYHLYISVACPFACRAYIGLALKGLEDVVSVTNLHWKRNERGWTFNDEDPDCSLDIVNNCTDLRDVYLLADPKYDGRISVPVLWDKKNKTVVSNDSGEILRMFNSEFNEFCKTPAQSKVDLYPENLRKKIDEINGWIYSTMNVGVYTCGFARQQEQYDKTVKEVFKALEKIEDMLSRCRYLTGSQLTEADIRLFVTLIRFDQVYHGQFKCNKKRLVDFPNIWGYTKELYQMPEIRKTVNMYHIKHHNMADQLEINPTGVVSVGPDIDFEEPHNRESLK